MTEENEARLRALAPHYFHRLAYFECGDGWVGLIEEVVAEAKKRNLVNFRFTQVKEKFGDLRVYVSMGDAVSNEDFRSFHEYLLEIERRSSTICEVCGAPGKHRKGGWIRTLCDAHSEKKAS